MTYSVRDTEVSFIDWKNQSETVGFGCLIHVVYCCLANMIDLSLNLPVSYISDR